jgi:hypothetical protein
LVAAKGIKKWVRRRPRPFCNQGVVFLCSSRLRRYVYLKSIKTSERLILPAIGTGSFYATKEQSIMETGVSNRRFQRNGVFAKIRFANRGYRDKGSADEKGGYCRVAVRRPVEYCYGV